MAADKEDGGVSDDDPYEILGVSKNADKREIRKRYQELVKKFHPDKLGINVSQSDRQSATKMFHKLSHAYHMLTDDVTRHLHDTESRAKQMTEDLIINDTVLISEMTFEPNEGYSSDCRCGGKYYIDMQQFDLSEDCHIISCDTCSLHIKIIL